MSQYTHIYLREKCQPIYGCALFFLGTTPSRQLEVLPYSEEACPLSKELLEDDLLFYEEEIQSFYERITKAKSQLDILEKRILMADPMLYDTINRDIEEHRDCIEEEQESLEEYENIYRKFKFVENIIDNPDNSGYELLYTKC